MNGAFGRLFFLPSRFFTLCRKPMVHQVFRLACCWVLLSLTGCAAGLGTEWVTLVSAVRGDFAADKLQRIPHAPNPAYTYLRVELDGFPPAMMVLGYVDAHPLGPIEVWYSAQGEVIKTQNGRLVGSTGLPLDWAGVRFTAGPPPWAAVAQGGASFTRVHDELPSYRFGIVDQVAVMPVPGFNEGSLPFTLPASLPRAGVVAYHWFRESVASGPSAALPDSWFAVGQYLGQTAVVYSRQCLRPDYCMHLQRWPVQEASL